MADNTFTGDIEFMSEVEDAKMEVGFNGADEMEGYDKNLDFDDWAKWHFEIQDQMEEYGGEID